LHTLGLLCNRLSLPILQLIKAVGNVVMDLSHWILHGWHSGQTHALAMPPVSLQISQAGNGLPVANQRSPQKPVGLPAKLIAALASAASWLIESSIS
jgi:hypothetical protein